MGLRRLRLGGFAIPFGIGKMMVSLNEIVDGEVVLAFEQPGATANDLFELDHGIDWAHQDDVADVAGVHAGGEFLGGGQDRGGGLFVILKIAEMLFPEFTVVGGDTLAVVGVVALFDLVDGNSLACFSSFLTRFLTLVG